MFMRRFLLELNKRSIILRNVKFNTKREKKNALYCDKF